MKDGRQFPERGKENEDTIWSWAEQGFVSPHIHEVLPLSDIKTGIADIVSRKVIGKLVITP